MCAASCGPGNLHLINGLFDANRSRVPVLAIASHIPGDEIGSEYFPADASAESVPRMQRLLRARQRAAADAARPGDRDADSAPGAEFGVVVIRGDVFFADVPSGAKAVPVRAAASVIRRQRIMRAEGQASGSPRDPDFGGHALEIARQTVSEDFSNIPDAARVPYTYWGARVHR